MYLKCLKKLLNTRAMPSSLYKTPASPVSQYPRCELHVLFTENNLQKASVNHSSPWSRVGLPGWRAGIHARWVCAGKDTAPPECAVPCSLNSSLTPAAVTGTGRRKARGSRELWRGAAEPAREQTKCLSRTRARRAVCPSTKPCFEAASSICTSTPC